MEQTINDIFAIPNMDGYVVEYYPHITKQYEQGGIIANDDGINIANRKIMKEETVVEYIYREKKLLVHENGDREYISAQQEYNIIGDGLYVISNIEYIDPNKFPILNKYYDTIRKTVTTYDDKYITISIINEGNFSYLKISFTINYNEQYKRSIIRHIKEVLSSLQHN